MVPSLLRQRLRPGVPGCVFFGTGCIQVATSNLESQAFGAPATITTTTTTTPEPSNPESQAFEAPEPEPLKRATRCDGATVQMGTAANGGAFLEVPEFRHCGLILEAFLGVPEFWRGGRIVEAFSGLPEFRQGGRVLEAFFGVPEFRQ